MFGYLRHKKILQRYIEISDPHIGDKSSLTDDSETLTDSLHIGEDMGIEKYSFS
jgi:hypothetical protein